MKNPVVDRMRRLIRDRSVCVLLLTVLLCFSAGGIAAGSSGGEHGGEPKGWVATDTYRVMNFAVLAVALFFILRKPVSQALNARIDGIRENLDDLEARREKAEKELAGYRARLASLEKEAEKIVAEYVRQGNEARDRILKEAESAAAKLEEQAQRNIEYEFRQIRLRLQEDILEKALGRAEEMLRSGITEEDQDRLVDEYLRKVVA
ncbi:MAG: ATP synthase F0 subunit B [Desulfobacterales bacterium]